MSWKQTWQVRLFALKNIPTLFFTGPRVLTLTDQECEIVIPLNWRTKNHLRSMYFGVLACGADCAGGLIAMEAIRKSGKKVQLIFKDFYAEFLKRAEADVHFKCTEGSKIIHQVGETLRSGARTNQTLSIIATTPSMTGDEPVAKFRLTLSLKAVS